MTHLLPLNFILKRRIIEHLIRKIQIAKPGIFLFYRPVGENVVPAA